MTQMITEKWGNSLVNPPEFINAGTDRAPSNFSGMLGPQCDSTVRL